MARLLLDQGADIAARENGRLTPLDLILENQHGDVVQLPRAPVSKQIVAQEKLVRHHGAAADTLVAGDSAGGDPSSMTAPTGLKLFI